MFSTMINDYEIILLQKLDARIGSSGLMDPHVIRFPFVVKTVTALK